jgi:hypothetical protein
MVPTYCLKVSLSKGVCDQYKSFLQRFRSTSVVGIPEDLEAQQFGNHCFRSLMLS